MKFLVPTLLLFFAACSSPQKLLLNTWKIEDIEFIDSLNTFTAEQKKNMKEELKANFFIRFQPDSVYTATHVRKDITGKWWFDTKKKTLYTTNRKDGTVISKIYELSKDRLKFETSNEEYLTFIYTFSPK